MWGFYKPKKKVGGALLEKFRHPTRFIRQRHIKCCIIIDKNAYKYLPKNYAAHANALPVRVVEIFSDEIANLNIEGDVDAQYKAFVEMVLGKVAEREKEN